MRQGQDLRYHPTALQVPTNQSLTLFGCTQSYPTYLYCYPAHTIPYSIRPLQMILLNYLQKIQEPISSDCPPGITPRSHFAVILSSAGLLKTWTLWTQSSASFSFLFSFHLEMISSSPINIIIPTTPEFVPSALLLLELPIQISNCTLRIFPEKSNKACPKGLPHLSYHPPSNYSSQELWIHLPPNIQFNNISLYLSEIYLKSNL